MLGGHVTIEDFVVMGGCSAVHQYSSIGKYVMIGGLSRVVQDVPPYMIAAGYDLKLFGPNTIGLKRNGFSDEEINRIKKAYKILFREKLTLNT
jgi:UDP-N-acetylglucosamine acyltransferase